VVTPARALALAGQGVLLPSGGPGISRRSAQQLARRELARSIYQPSLEQRILNSISIFLRRLLSDASANFPGGWWALVAVIAAAVLLGSTIFFWIRPSRTRAAVGAVLQGAVRSASDHRQEAQRLAAAGEYAAAIVESMRAIAVELEERGVLLPRPGRTADELAAEAAGALPGQAAGLSAAARLFDDVRYGGRPGSSDGYQRMQKLDSQIRAGRTTPPAPRLAGTAAGPPS
jgi:hypothetical protein